MSEVKSGNMERQFQTGSKVNYTACSLQGRFTYVLSFDLEQPCQVYKAKTISTFHREIKCIAGGRFAQVHTIYKCKTRTDKMKTDDTIVGLESRYIFFQYRSMNCH